MKIEKVFAVMRCDDEKILYALYMLQGDAFNWWQRMQHKYEQEGEQLERDFEEHFMINIFLGM